MDGKRTPSPSLPWLRWRVGQRVVVRYRAEDGVHDALGYLTQVSPHEVSVETKRGLVQVPAHTMITGKLVPAPVSQRPTVSDQ